LGGALIYQMDDMFAIKTKRLILRDLLAEDESALHQLRSNPAVTQYIDYIKSETEADTYQWLRGTIMHNARMPRLSYNLAIVRQMDNQVMGWIGIGQPSDPTSGDLDFGYALLPDFWGQGYMSEALEALLGYAFESLGAQRIFGECEVVNEASARVMEKVGLHLETRRWERKESTEKLSETLRYVIRREEWKRCQTDKA
jgi:[ribosomal protein S5]-alanine N-acetyltransferase